jgi:hypothetical protein
MARHISTVVVRYDQFNNLSLPEDVKVIGAQPQSTTDLINGQVELICESARFPGLPQFCQPYRTMLDELISPVAEPQIVEVGVDRHGKPTAKKWLCPGCGKLKIYQLFCMNGHAQIMKPEVTESKAERMARIDQVCDDSKSSA